MRHEVRFSGFGGQGIILAAVILGRAAVMYDNKYAVQTQVYGPQARGGASMSAVIIDDDPIMFPKITTPDEVKTVKMSDEEARLSVYAPAGDIERIKVATFQPAINMLNSDGLDIQVFVYDKDAPPLKG